MGRLARAREIPRPRRFTTKKDIQPSSLEAKCASCYLRECQQFWQLNGEQKSVIARLLQKQIAVREKSEVATAGKSSELYTLHEGWAYRYIVLSDQRRQIINFILPGDTIGLDAALYGTVAYSVAMLTSGILCCFGQQTIGTLLKASPAFGEYLLKSSIADVRRLKQQIVDLGRKSAEERMASLLLGLFIRSAAITRTTPGPLSCFFPPTQRHLADAAGLTPTHVSNTLTRLRAEGIVELSGKLLTIHDLPRLQKLAGMTTSALDKKFLF